MATDIEAIRGRAPGEYFYIPRVTPERGPNGEPTVMLLDMGSTGQFQCGAQLTATEQELDSLRKQLAAREVDAPISLVAATIAPREARLEVIPDGEARTIAVSGPQSYPPYTMIMSVSLSGTDLKCIASALQGETGKARIAYEVDVSSVSGAKAVIGGDASSLMQDSPFDIPLWIDEALNKGLLTIEVTSWGTRADALGQKAAQAAKKEAAAIVTTMRDGSPSEANADTHTSAVRRENSVKAEIQLEEPDQLSKTLDADLGSWFKTQKARVVAAAAPATAAAGAGTTTGHSVRVSLGFNGKNAPLAFVELRGSGQTAALRGSDFVPVAAWTDQDGSTDVTTHYTNGAKPYRTRVQMSGASHELSAADTGLTIVKVDATARKAAGAKQLSVSVRLKREGETAEEWPITFKYGDWTEEWFVVTGGSGLEGSLEYEWTETGPDDQVTPQPARKITQTTIRIE